LKRMTNGTLRDEMKGKPTKKTRFNSLSFDWVFTRSSHLFRCIYIHIHKDKRKKCGSERNEEEDDPDCGFDVYSDNKKLSIIEKAKRVLILSSSFVCCYLLIFRMIERERENGSIIYIFWLLYNSQIAESGTIYEKKYLRLVQLFDFVHENCLVDAWIGHGRYVRERKREKEIKRHLPSSSLNFVCLRFIFSQTSYLTSFFSRFFDTELQVCICGFDSGPFWVGSNNCRRRDSRSDESTSRSHFEA
jgi:hypothetical protein